MVLCRFQIVVFGKPEIHFRHPETEFVTKAQDAVGGAMAECGGLLEIVDSEGWVLDGGVTTKEMVGAGDE